MKIEVKTTDGRWVQLKRAENPQMFEAISSALAAKTSRSELTFEMISDHPELLSSYKPKAK